MEIRLIHHTADIYNSKEDGNLDITSIEKQAMILAGREAGICYMSENYLSEKIQNTESAIKRANNIIKSGHHSPFDHYTIGLEIVGIPKIVAMLLNSVEVYTTSEKSGRYTVMAPETNEEVEIYEKWKHRFSEIIKQVYPDKFSDKQVEKLALENARYMLSVFTPTTMGYTVSFRQLSYMVGWLEKLISNCEKCRDDFSHKLIEPLTELHDKFKQFTGDKLRDNKNRQLEFFSSQNNLNDNTNYVQTYVGDTYSIKYAVSFVTLAQLQRHRTIHYEMKFNSDSSITPYIPQILFNQAGKDYIDDWVEDFNTLVDLGIYPNCTIVNVLEQGRTVDFVNKCKERLCGRAQLEVVKNVVEQINKMKQYTSNMSTDTLNSFNNLLLNGETRAKCAMENIICTEHCDWGAVGALNREV